MMQPLPQLRIELPEWKPRDFTVLHRSVKKIEEIGKSTGTGSVRFKIAREQLARAAKTGGLPYLITQLNEILMYEHSQILFVMIGLLVRV